MSFKYAGTISHGTLRYPDLAQAFLPVVADLNPERYQEIIEFYSGLDAALEDSDSDWWDGEMALYLMDDLFEGLYMVEVEGYYFGCHEGDGSDFGFWPVEDEE